MDDPLCQVELGLTSDNGHGNAKLSKEASDGFFEKLLKDGDSPELRNEVLKNRKDRS
jgi:hypothetical protein